MTFARGAGAVVPVELSWRERLALWVYGAAMRLARPLLLRKLKRRAESEPGYAHDVPARFGCYGAKETDAHAPTGNGLADAPRVWVHAVSLGEARTAAILLAALREQVPGMRLLLTHTTATGWAEGSRHLVAGDLQTWLPWDDADAVTRFLHHFRPDIGVLMETEVWPVLVRTCAGQGVPLVLANARLNQRSWRQACRLRWLSRPAYAGLAAVWAQSAADVQRLTDLGAPVGGAWGNLKFDAHPDPGQCLQARQWRQAQPRPVVMLASSRAGEELEFVKQISALTLYGKGLSATFSDESPVQWLIVPRHPQRFDEVADLIRAQGWDCWRRSEWGDCLSQGRGTVSEQGKPVIWLGDSLGEMALYYSLADVALLGGSFEPLGGQNLIEAAACGCPVVLGPHTFNFAEVSDQAVMAGAARRVVDLGQGVQAALHCVSDPDARQAAVQAALGFAHAHRGAAARTAQAITQLLTAR